MKTFLKEFFHECLLFKGDKVSKRTGLVVWVMVVFIVFSILHLLYFHQWVYVLPTRTDFFK
jgi:hypothetical protein